MKFEPKLFNAVYALVGGGISASDDVTKVEDFIFSDGQKPPTQEEAENKLAELKADYDSQEYARTRAPLYPPIGDQLDDLYKKGAFSDEMTAKIKKVKDDNPKPE